MTPRYPDEAMRELERCFDELGMYFLKLYPDYLGKPIDDPAYTPIFEWADGRGIVVMSHSSYFEESDTLTAPRRFTGLAQRYTRVRWVLAHSGNAAAGQAQAVEAARTCPNVFLETCTSWGQDGTIEYLVEGGTLAASNVEGAAGSVGSIRCAEVCVHDVVNERKVSTLLTIPVHRDGCSIQETGCE